MDALCIGHACLDLIFAVDDYPAEDSKVLAARRSVSGGGPTANAAALLAYWGIDAGFAGPLGNDDLGTLVLSDFKRFGVDTSLTVRCEGYPTPLSSIIAGSRTGSRTIVNHRSTEDIYRLPEQVSAPEILLFDGHALHASLDALERFPNVPSVLDAGSLREATWTLAEKVDYLVASAPFSAAALGRELKRKADISGALELLQKRNGGCTVITLGERGGVYAVGNSRAEYAPFRVKAVDSTAAGDIFHGAFVYGLLKGWPLDQILDFSARTAGISVSRSGGRESFPPLDEVLAAG